MQTHIVMLNAPEYRRRVYDLILENRVRAEIAVEQVLTELMALFERSNEKIVAAKSCYLHDLLLRMKMKLLGEENIVLEQVTKEVSNPVVFVGKLLPAFVIKAADVGVAALIVEDGTSLSHAAILAKSFNIPVLKTSRPVAVKLLEIVNTKENIDVFVDAVEGRLILHPDDLMARTNQARSGVRDQADSGPIPVSLWLNVANPNQVVDTHGIAVEGIGLYRREFVFMKRTHGFPAEDEQYEEYSQLISKYGDQPVTIRTLDIGGDKTLPYFSLGPQDNPFLGLRGNRVFRYHPEILITQLKAILRAGIRTKSLRVLFPMVENLDDLLFLFDQVDTAVKTLRTEQKPYQQDFSRGAMIEVPSAVWGFQTFLPYVGFVSVGTNDLLQYFFAVDRINANVGSFYLPEDPAALSMLKFLVDGSKEAGKPITLCGEIALNPNLLPALPSTQMVSILIRCAK